LVVNIRSVKMSVKIIIILLSFIPFSVTAWDGYDYTEGSYVEIDKGNLVRPGEEIEVYDYGNGEYRDMEVQSMDSSGYGVEVEVYDYNTGEYRTFEME
jgi:hypothetical protein